MIILYVLLGLVVLMALGICWITIRTEQILSMAPLRGHEYKKLYSVVKKEFNIGNYKTCNFSYQSKSRKVVEQCDNKEPISYKLNRNNNLQRPDDTIKITGYEIIPNKAVILSIIYL